MTTPEIITLLLKKQNRTQKELSDFLGVSQSTITDWKKGKTESYKDYLPQISEFFSVSIDYLLTGEEAKKETTQFQKKLDRFEEKFDKLPDDAQERVLKILQATLDAELESKR